MEFDIFCIWQWKQGYTLHVDIARPGNAPRHRYTKADIARKTAANKKNIELAESGCFLHWRNFSKKSRKSSTKKRIESPE